MSEEIDKILKESTGILMAIDELHNELPKVQKAKEQIDKYVQEFNQSLKNATMLIEKNDKNIAFQKEKITNLIEQGENNIKNIQMQINKSLEKYKNVDEYIDELNMKILKIEEEQKKIISAIKTIQTNDISSSNINTQSVDIDMLIDYLQPHDIKYLFRKYKNKMPVVVRKAFPTESSATVWSQDFCFLVKDIQNDIAIGDYYENGKLKKQEGKHNPSVKQKAYVLLNDNLEIE